jgi:PAS domain S-box-containing protein
MHPANMPVSAVLGLTDKGDLDWARLRGLQYSGLAKLAFYRLFVTALLAVFVAQIYGKSVGWLGVGAWVAVLAAVHVRGYKLDLALADSDRRRIVRADFKRQAQTAAMSASAWAAAVVVFPFYGTPGDLLAMLLVVAVLIAGSVFFFTTAPIGIVYFTVVLGAAAILHVAIAGLWMAVVAIVLFMIAAVLGTVEVARVYLTARMAEAAVTEKEEVVSLLLREFEENEADWLWEIDPARRLRSVSPRFAFALGRSQVDIEGAPLMEIVAGANWQTGQFPPSLHDLAERLKNRENFANLLVQVSIQGEERWWELSGTPMRDEQARFTGFRGVGSDVTEQRKSSEKIAYLARYDTLTQLPNRLQITEHWVRRCDIPTSGVLAAHC